MRSYVSTDLLLAGVKRLPMYRTFLSFSRRLNLPLAKLSLHLSFFMICPNYPTHCVDDVSGGGPGLHVFRCLCRLELWPKVLRQPGHWKRFNWRWTPFSCRRKVDLELKEALQVPQMTPGALLAGAGVNVCADELGLDVWRLERGICACGAALLLFIAH